MFPLGFMKVMPEKPTVNSRNVPDPISMVAFIDVGM
jgi:hypothetical protein